MISFLRVILSIASVYLLVSCSYLALVGLFYVCGATSTAILLSGLYPLAHLGMLIIGALAMLGFGAYAWVQWFRALVKSD